MYPLVRELAAPGACLRVPVVVTCRVLGFTSQAFYRWCAHPISDWDWEEADIVDAAFDVLDEDPAFANRPIHDELGFMASGARVGPLCSENSILHVIHRRRGAGKDASTPVHDDHDDHDKRDFTAIDVNTLWLTEITKHHATKGKLYLCVVKVCSSNKIVGYSIDSRMKAVLAVDTLKSAISQRNPRSTLIHSDQGFQFPSKKYDRLIDFAGLQGSMDRVGACADSAAMESFFALLQKNVVNQKR